MTEILDIRPVEVMDILLHYWLQIMVWGFNAKLRHLEKRIDVMYAWIALRPLKSHVDLIEALQLVPQFLKHGQLSF